MQNLSVCLQLLQMLCEQKNIITEQEEEFRPETYSLFMNGITALQETLLQEAQYFLKGEKDFSPEEEKASIQENRTVVSEIPVSSEDSSGELYNNTPESVFPEAGELYVSQGEGYFPDAGIAGGVMVTSARAEETTVKQTGETQWSVPDGIVICQTQEIVVTRNGESVPIRFSIAPLQVVRDGLVPVIANAEYQSFTINQMTTFMSETDESLLQMDVDQFTFLIKGSFSNGVFCATIMSTGRSVDNGDVIEVKAIQSNEAGTIAAPKIQLHDNATLWIAFNKEHFFGVLHSGEWTDEFNASHDVMIEVNGDYNELKATHDDEWILRY